MPVFKGWTEREDGETLAVLNYEKAKRTAFYLNTDETGAIRGLERVTQANPHSEQFSENDLIKKYRLSFEDLEGIKPGTELGGLIKSKLQTPAPSQSHTPSFQ